jgi:hypothetical protein
MHLRNTVEDDALEHEEMENVVQCVEYGLNLFYPDYAAGTPCLSRIRPN